MLPVALSQFPSGASLKQLIHYAQEIMSGMFTSSDYCFDTTDLCLQTLNDYEQNRYNLDRFRSL